MEPNLTIYEIAVRYCLMALFVGIGAALTNPTGNWVSILGYILMVIGVIYFLMAILAYDPTKGSNKKALEEAEEDFKDVA